MENLALAIELLSLDLNALQIQFARELPEQRALMVFSGGVAGLADRHILCDLPLCDTGNKHGATCCGGLDRPSPVLVHTPADRDPLRHLKS